MKFTESIPNPRSKYKFNRLTFWFLVGVFIGGLISIINDPYFVEALEFGTPTSLSTNQDYYNVTQIQTYYDGTDWFIIYGNNETGTNPLSWIAKFDSGLATREQGFNQINIPSASEQSYFIEEIANFSELLVGSTRSDTGDARGFDKEDLSASGDCSVNYGLRVFPSLARNYPYTERYYFCGKSSETSATVTCFHDINTSTAFSNCGTGSQTLYLPAETTDARHGKLYYISEFNSYIFLFESEESGTSQIWATFYNSTLGYLNKISISGSSDFGSTYWSPSLLEVDDVYYITFYDDTETGTIHIMHMDLVDSETFNLMREDLVNATNVDGNNNRTQSPYLAHRENQFYLFYSVINKTVEPHGQGLFYSTVSDIECGYWLDDECVNEMMRQRQYCTNETYNYRYESSTFCSLEYNRTQGIFTPRNKTVTGSQSCDTGWEDPREVESLRCDASVDLPINCSNIQTNATLILDVEKTWIGFLGDTRYHFVLCNPLDDCFEEDYLCESQYNMTQTKDWDSYYAGETATAGFIVTGSPCKLRRQLLIESGWKRYRVMGVLHYNCDIICGGWTCVTRGLVDYRIWQEIDCSYNESRREVCDYGCRDDECLTSAEDVEDTELDTLATEIGSPVGQLLGVGMSSMDSMFPSSDLKILGATIMTVGVGVGIAGFTRKKWGILLGMLAMLPMTFFFIIRGYYPVWLGVLIAIPSVAFIVVFITGLRTGR